MKFETALNRTALDDIIYISIGSNLSKKASAEKVRTQQFPQYIKNAVRKGKKAIIILIDVGFIRNTPNIFDQYIELKKGKSKLDTK